MARVFVDITVSLDGCVAGPHATLESPLGEGGELLHEWLFALAPFRERHGMTGGVVNADAEVYEASAAATGAIVMGRRMFSGGEGGWEDDPNANGWWGDAPPFGVPVFVVTHHARERVEKGGGTSYTFVTGGTDAALEQAKAAAGGRDVLVAGGAAVVRQALEAGLVDELQLHVAPLLLGGGVRLFDGLGPARFELESVAGSEAVTHLRYRPRG